MRDPVPLPSAAPSTPRAPTPRHRAPTTESLPGDTALPQQEPPPCRGGASPIYDSKTEQGLVEFLRLLAEQRLVAGSKPLFMVAAGYFQPGQCLEVVFELKPGKCYGVVGASMATIQDLTLEIHRAGPHASVAGAPIATETSPGSIAVLGEKPNCLRATEPTPELVKVRVKASEGMGLAAARVYEK